MIAVEFRYHNMLLQRSGVKSEVRHYPAGTTLGQAVDELAQAHGPTLGEMLLSGPETLSPHMVVFVDDQLVTGDRQSRTLADGDTVLLFPAISGG